MRHWFDRLLARTARKAAPPASLDAEASPPVMREMKLGDDVKAIYPEEWQQDAILRAWNTGEPTVGKRPAQ